jgi:hypothetical protein
MAGLAGLGELCLLLNCTHTCIGIYTIKWMALLGWNQRGVEIMPTMKGSLHFRAEDVVEFQCCRVWRTRRGRRAAPIT